MGKIDTTQIKQNTDLIELAGALTPLHRASRTEYAGPCPKCGGDDRFHVTRAWFFCRQCHTRRGDAIAFMRWLHGDSFQEACKRLQHDALLPTPFRTAALAAKPRRSQPHTPFDVGYYTGRVAAAHGALFNAPAAAAGRAYLESRGLEPHTWLAYKVGYQEAVALPGAGGKQKAPALSLPWYVAGALTGVRYRFLQTHEYSDSEGRPRSAKQTGRGAFAGKLFGGQLLPRCAEAQRTLVLCEGELNALSLWQVAHDTNLDVLSLGSESQRLTPAMIDYANRYGAVILWLDQTRYVAAKAGELNAAWGLASPDGADANDLLQAGDLGGVLSALRLRAARSRVAQEKLLWDLCQRAAQWSGVERGTAEVIHKVADVLHVDVSLTEVEPNRWLIEPVET